MPEHRTYRGNVTEIAFGHGDGDNFVRDGHVYVTVRLDDDDAEVSGGRAVLTIITPNAETNHA